MDLPTRFFDDHLSRDLSAPPVVKQLARTVRVEVDPGHPGWVDLLSDARHYAADLGETDPYYLGLIASAKATARKMEQASRAWEESR